MNDFDLAVNKVGNRYDLVLIASQRARELNKQRRQQWENSGGVVKKTTNAMTVAEQAIHDVESGRVGREYLLRGSNTKPKRKEKFDEI